MKMVIETRMKGGLSTLFLALATAASTTAADLRVPADYPTIQAAVDTANSNDVIRIAAGVYPEQVRINANKLTLIGQPGAILRATEAMSRPPDSFNIPIMFIKSSDVTIRGLTFEGERLAESFVGEGDLLGLLLRQSCGAVEYCAFYGFRAKTHGPELAGPLWIQNFEEPEINVRVAGCTFADSYGGMFLSGIRGRQNLTVTIENNTIAGLGPIAPSYNSSGIEIAPGVGGRIAGNTISGFSYIGTAPLTGFPISFGILASDNPGFSELPALQIEGNTLRDNQMHIALTKANGSIIRNNRIQGSAPGIAPLGVAVSGTNITIANNQFEAMPEGIRLLGNEPLRDELPTLPLGDILGVASGTHVTSNRFCSVTEPLNRQSPATATETGTQLGACSSPSLVIAPATLVSWPGDEDGWTIESALSLNGPWAASTATPFIQHGRYNIAVPTEGKSQFFRAR